MSEDRLAEIKALWGVWADNAAETDGTSREQRLREITLLADDMRWLFTEVERLRAENANLKRLLDDANERAAQIEDWQIKCALLEVDRDKARAENAALAGERDRLREALEGMWAEEVESIIVGFTNKQPVYGDAYCRRCNARASKQANIVHRNDCPFAVLNEEPTDGE